jgi:hypothetical protein
MDDLIREIEVDLITGNRQHKDIDVHAGIYKDGHTECLIVSICDARLCDGKLRKGHYYQMKFNSAWMEDNNQDWLAGVLVRGMIDTINQAQNNIREKYKENLLNLRKLSMVE